MTQSNNTQAGTLEEALDTDLTEAEEMAAGEIEEAGQMLAAVRAEISGVVFGQEEVVDEALITLIAGGHGLLVGVPGLAKTLLVETLATVMGLSEKRIQFTPDLLPADILGSEVLEQSETGQRSFRFIKGPVFCQLLMADEINRASPRTQSALLQAMQEKEVTVAGVPHALPDPFHVLATQNPIEQEGTYPLPEAQLDRFFMQINVDYPDEAAEREVILRTTGPEETRARRIIDGDKLKGLQQLVRRIPVGESVVSAILKLVRSARPEDASSDIIWGPGPRGAQCLMLAARARALLDGRLSPSIDDVVTLAGPVLRHRMALGFAARADGATVDDVIRRLASAL